MDELGNQSIFRGVKASNTPRLTSRGVGLWKYTMSVAEGCSTPVWDVKEIAVYNLSKTLQQPTLWQTNLQ